MQSSNFLVDFPLTCCVQLFQANGTNDAAAAGAAAAGAAPVITFPDDYPNSVRHFLLIGFLVSFPLSFSFGRQSQHITRTGSDMRRQDVHGGKEGGGYSTDRNHSYK